MRHSSAWSPVPFARVPSEALTLLGRINWGRVIVGGFEWRRTLCQSRSDPYYSYACRPARYPQGAS